MCGISMLGCEGYVLGDVREISLAELKLIFHGSVLRKVVLERMMQITKKDFSPLPTGHMVQSVHEHT